MIKSGSVLGVVLAGGLSTRMEGEEKSLVLLNGKTMIERACKRLAQQVEPIAINANGDAARFAWLSYPVFEDTITGNAGPLAGVLASMRWAQANTDCSAILTAATDTPFFPDDYAKKMQAAGDNNTIVIATSGGYNHPVFGLWPISLADKLEAFLQSGDRKVMLFVRQFDHAFVDFEMGRIDPFFNINSPDDLAAAEHHISTWKNNE